MDKRVRWLALVADNHDLLLHALTSFYEKGKDFGHYRNFSSHCLSFVLQAKELTLN